jgi:HK97 family phage major capsid protein
LQRKHALKVAEVKALIEKSDDEAVSDEDKSAFEAIKGELATLKESIALLKEVRELEAESAEPVEDEEKAFVPARKSNLVIRNKSSLVVAPGIRAARFIMAKAIAKQEGSLSAGMHFAEKMLGDDIVAKALNTTTQVDGGAGVPQDFVAEIIDLLRAKTVIRGSGARMVPMPMGNLTYPRLQASSTASWIGELDGMTASQPAFDNLYFTAKKLVASVAVSNDLLRRSPLSVESIIRDDMIAQLSLAEDKQFLIGTGSAVAPAGLLNQIIAGNKITDTTASPNLQTVSQVLNALELLLTASNVDTASALFIFHPAVRSFLSTLTDSTGHYFFRDELEQGRLLGYPYKTTTQLPTNLGTGNDTYIFFVNMNDVIVADTMGLRVDSSDVATYTQSAAQYSAFSYDQTVFRCISEVDLGLRHLSSGAVATVRNWKPTNWTSNAGITYVSEPAVTTGTAAKSAKP